MKKVIFIVAFIWQSIIAAISPFWLGIMYLCITGNSKGYGTDLQDETDISAMIGVVMLILWIVAAVPSGVWLTKVCYQKRKQLAFLPISLFFSLSVLTILLVGWNEFMKPFQH